MFEDSLPLERHQPSLALQDFILHSLSGRLKGCCHHINGTIDVPVERLTGDNDFLNGWPFGMALLGIYEGENILEFDWNLIEAYKGNVPFLISGGIGMEDVERIKAISHPLFAGIDINSKFETEPGVKDVEAIRRFLEKLKN